MSRLRSWIQSRQSQPVSWLSLLILLNLLWRGVRYGLRFPLWGDESMLAVNFLVRSWRGLLEPLEYVQVAPIGFLWAEKLLVTLVGSSEYSLRAFAFVLGVASVPLFLRLANRLLSKRAALIAVAIFCASYYPVRHGVEVKPYGSDLFFALALLNVGWSLQQQPRSVRLWLGWLLLGGLSIWCSYPAAFVVSGLQCVMLKSVLSQRNGRLLAAWTATGAAFAACLAGTVLLAGQGQAESAASFMDSDMWRDAFVPVERPWEIPLWLLRTHAGRMLAYPFGGQNYGSSWTLILVLVAMVALVRRNRRSRNLLLFLLAPAIMALVASALKRYPYGGSARTTLFLAPSICLLVGAGWREIMLRCRRWLPPATLQGLICLSCLAIALVGIGRDIARPYKTLADEQNRVLCRELLANVEAGDVIVFENAAVADPARPYTIPGAGLTLSSFSYYLLADAPVPLYWGTPAAELPEVSGTVWLVLHDTDSSPLAPTQLLEYERGFDQRFGPATISRRKIDENEVIRVRPYQQSRIRLPGADGGLESFELQLPGGVR